MIDTAATILLVAGGIAVWMALFVLTTQIIEIWFELQGLSHERVTTFVGVWVILYIGAGAIALALYL